LPLTAKTKLAIIVSVVLIGSAATASQVETVAQAGGPPIIRTPHPSREEERAHQDQLKRLNAARQAALKKDTDKLLQLATELKHSVDKTNEQTLSLDVVKKAEEIEKLAKSIKEKMKSGY